MCSARRGGRVPSGAKWCQVPKIISEPNLAFAAYITQLSGDSKSDHLVSAGQSGAGWSGAGWGEVGLGGAGRRLPQGEPAAPVKTPRASLALSMPCRAIRERRGVQCEGDALRVRCALISAVLTVITLATLLRQNRSVV